MISHSNRGKALEEQIDWQNLKYRNQGRGCVQKIDTPTKIIQSQGHGRYTCVFDPSKSTVDYQGNLDGIPLSFDAKQTDKKPLRLAQIKDHQIDWLIDAQKGGAFSFILFDFSGREKYVVPIDFIMDFKSTMVRKSIPIDTIMDSVLCREIKGVCDYLSGVKQLYAHNR